MRLAVCSRSCLEPQSLVQAWFLGVSAVCVFHCTGGRTAERAVEFVGLSHKGESAVCDNRLQGDTGGHAVGSDQS